MNTFLNLSCSTSISTLEGDNVLYTAQTAPVQPYDEGQQREAMLQLIYKHGYMLMNQLYNCFCLPMLKY